MQLALDIGNTRTKAAVFEGRNLLETALFENNHTEFLEKLLLKYPQITASIISSVIADSTATESLLAARTSLLQFSHITPLPIKNSYESPETLGKDRLAAAVGAWSMFKNKNVLIIDAGTALKADLLTSAGEYLGGSIAPGLQMRFQALHHFTGRLPLIDADKNYKSLTGKNTRESILNGVQNGMLYEVQGLIHAYKEQYPDLQIILTGGDAPFFELGLKNHIFAVPGLVLAGLNEIVLFNAQA